MLLEQNPQAPFKVLVLCTGNSARSILAEALFNKASNGLFEAFSAGSHPTGRVNPFALELLEQQGFDCSAFKSKSWDEFACDDAPEMDFVVTVCGNAAAENCPAFQGSFNQIHWGLPDPAEFTDFPEKAREAFSSVYSTLKQRIETLAQLPTSETSKESIRQRMEAFSH